MNDKKSELLYYQKQFLDNFNHLLYKHHWSIRKLSDISGLSYETVKKLAAGKISNPSLYSIIKLCIAFDCSIDQLIGFETSKTRSLKEVSKRTKQLLYEIQSFEKFLKQKR